MKKRDKERRDSTESRKKEVKDSSENRKKEEKPKSIVSGERRESGDSRKGSTSERRDSTDIKKESSFKVNKLIFLLLFCFIWLYLLSLK